ncbi:MAG: hypothetical protein SOZ24_01745, partial [Treponema sp.]|nr:hypothetical protein [Treponema sp.]
MEVKILIKKLPICILYKQKKSLKSALERKVFIVVLRGKAGIFLKIVKILIGCDAIKGGENGF